MADVEVDGWEELSRALTEISRDVNGPIARSAVTAGLRIISKQIRKEISSTKAASPHLRRAAKKTIGQRVGMRNRKVAFGMSGFGVGKKKYQVEVKRSGKNVTRSGKPKGVGAGPASVHWFTLGTQYRNTKTPRRATGKIHPVFGKVVEESVRVASKQAIAKARDVVTLRLAQAAARAQFKHNTKKF